MNLSYLQVLPDELCKSILSVYLVSTGKECANHLLAIKLLSTLLRYLCAKKRKEKGI